MFLNKNYVLGNELCDFLNIHKANISILRKERESVEDFNTVVKLNGISVVNLKSKFLPNNLKLSPEDIKKAKFTDISDKLPLSYIEDELDLTPKELNVLGAKEVNIKYGNLKEIKLWKFPDEIVQLKNIIPYTLNSEEYFECLKKKQIDGGIQVKPSKYFVWYKLRK